MKTETTFRSLFALCLIFMWSCKKDGETVPKIIDDLPETQSEYSIEVNINGTFDDGERVFTKKTLTYEYSKDGLKNSTTDVSASELVLSQIIREEIGTFTSCLIPIESIQIIIEKTKGETMNIEDISLKFETIPDNIGIYDGKEGEEISDEISFTKDSDNAAKSVLEIVMKSKCASPQALAQLRIDKKLSARLRRNNSEELFNFTQTITQNEFTKISTYNLLQFSNFRQTENKLSDIDLENNGSPQAIWEASDVTIPIEVNRIHTIGSDNCSQPLAAINIDFSRFLKSDEVKYYDDEENDFTLFFYELTLSGNHPSINTTLNPKMDGKDLIGADLSLDFNCSSTNDVNHVFYLLASLKKQRFKAGVGQDIETTFTNYVIPVGVKVDVQ